HPDEAAARLIYADWLEDRDDPRAAWVRRGCDVLAAPAGSTERRALRESFRRALPPQGQTWPELEGLPLTWDKLLSVFRYRLAEAITWCSGRGLPFRSDDLHPGPPFRTSAEATAWADAR